MAPAADNAASDVSKLARQKGRMGLRIDKTASVALPAGGVSSGLNIPA